MSKIVSFTILLIISISLTTNAYAHHFSYVGKQFDAKLENGKSLHIKFGNEPVYGFYRHDPEITAGHILSSNGISLTGVPVRAYENSFVISMPSEGWYIWGTHAKNDNYSINLYEWAGEKFLKTEFNTSLHDNPQITTEQNNPPKQENATKQVASVSTTPKKDLIMLVKQSLRNYWNDDYKVFVKVFDKKLNPNPDFDSFSGAVNDTDITVIISLPDGSEKKILSGKTQNGFWQGTQYFAERQDSPGKHIVNVVAKDGNSVVSQNYDMFLFATVLAPSGSNHAPIVSISGASSVNENDVGVQLTGTISDLDGDSLTFSWNAVNGTALANSNTLTPTFTAPDIPETIASTPSKVLIFDLTASDGAKQTTQRFIMTVINNTP
ncbi:MAG: hypothetical protein EPO62_04425 [Candidatus Nitrosotenuis sp.]|nr:MAG: hypothetical protein EPO62_04425 [Candidatus Nitrosotenuis sp.]